MLKRLLSRNILEPFFLITIFLVVALYPKFPFIKIPGTSVGIRIEDFLLFFLGVYVAFIYLRKIGDVLKKPLERSVVIFIVAGFISLVAAFFITKTISSHLGILHWARRIEYFIPLLFALSLARDKSRIYIDLVFKLILAVILGAAIYGFGQKYLSWPIIVTQNEQYSKGIALRYVPGAHLTSTFAGHYDLASFLVLVMPIVVAAFFVIKDKWQKALLILFFILGLWLLSNTLSRISIAAYLVAVTLTLILMHRFKEIIFVVFVSLFIFSFSTDLFDRYSTIIQAIKANTQKMMLISPPEVLAQGEIQKRQSSATPTPPPVPILEDRSTSIRLNVEWPRAIRAFTKNPFLGTGYSSITLATDNDYLRLLGEVGLLGFASFLLILGNVVVIGFSKLPFYKSFTGLELAFAAGFAGGFAGALINALFIDIFEASKFAIIFWFLLGIFVYTIRYGKSLKKV